jgi:acetyl esterase/lipase
MRRVPYGDHPSQFGMLSLPAGEPVGVAVLLHGGFWKPEYGMEYALPLVPSLLDRGWATWVVEYRRGTGAADTMADVRAAVDGVPVGAPVRVALGHSAGGHLAAWAATGGGLTAVIAQAGVLDLRAAHEAGLGDGAVERFLGHAPGPVDDPVDPIRRLPLGVPVWCVHGREDDVVPIDQSRSYVAAARAAGDRADLLEVEGDHFVVVDPDHAAWARTLEILDAISGGPAAAR